MKDVFGAHHQASFQPGEVSGAPGVGTRCHGARREQGGRMVNAAPTTEARRRFDRARRRRRGRCTSRPSADSLAYVKGGNVFLPTTDGPREFQVTTGGPGAPRACSAGPDDQPGVDDNDRVLLSGP
jgi:hypothetical protein